MIAIRPSVLARMLCRHCRACDFGEKRDPQQCNAVKKFIKQLRNGSNEEDKERQQILHHRHPGTGQGI